MINKLTNYRSTWVKMSVLLTIILFGGCKKEEKKIVDFALSSNTIEVPLNSVSYLPIKSGNGSYSIVTEDEHIASANYIEGGDLTFGSIFFNGKNKGETTLSITDMATGRLEKIRVSVTDFFLPLVVSETNHPALVKNMRILLVNNERKDVFFFLEKDEKLERLQQGTFAFETELKDKVRIPYLILRYPADENGQFVNSTTHAAVVHKFDLSGSRSQFFDLIRQRFNVNWELPAAPETKSSPISFIAVKMTAAGTNYSIQSYVSPSNWKDNISTK